MYVNPYAAWSGTGSWFKANFHIHAVPDGTAGAQTNAELTELLRRMTPPWAGAPKRGPLNEVSNVIALYRDAGYDVITISNQGSFWDTSELGRQLGIRTINGIEYVEQDGILCIGIREFITGTPQSAIDECARQGGFSIVCHPNELPEPGLPTLLSKSVIRTLRGFDGMEILTPAIFKGFLGSGLATDFWDELLTDGKLVWGFGNDDFHWPWEMDRGWNFILADSTEFPDLRAAVKRGSSYVSTGLLLESFSLEDGMLRVQATLPGTRPKRVHYEFVSENGAILSRQWGERAEYQMSGRERYLRIQASSDNGAMLWTQPVYDVERVKGF